MPARRKSDSSPLWCFEHSRSSMEATPNFARATQHASSSAGLGEASPAEVEGSPASLSDRSQALNTKL